MEKRGRKGEEVERLVGGMTSPALAAQCAFFFFSGKGETNATDCLYYQTP